MCCNVLSLRGNVVLLDDLQSLLILRPFLDSRRVDKAALVGFATCDITIAT